MKMLYGIKSTIILLLSLLVCGSVAAQEDIPLADAMRESGKIYVVVAVIAVIFIGIVLYLITLDRRISKMEQNLRERD